MRRSLLSLLLATIALMAAGQSTYHYRYWWDGDPTTMQKGDASTKKITLDVDVSALSSGLHVFYWQMEDEEGRLSPGNSDIFYLLPPSLVSEMKTAYYWLDRDITTKQEVTAGKPFTIDVSKLASGLHTLYYQVEDKQGRLSGGHADIFYLIPPSLASEMKTAYYWLDRDLSTQQEVTVGEAFTIDVSKLSSGLHTLYYQVEDKQGRLSGGHADIFYLIPPSLASEMKTAYYWLDRDLSTKQEVTAGEAFTIDVSKLASGLHTLYYQVEDKQGRLSGGHVDIFYLMPPSLASEMKTAYYWLDRDLSTKQEVTAGEAFTIDVSKLASGLHTLYYQVEDKQGRLSGGHADIFYLIPPSLASEMKTAYYWLDRDLSTQQEVTAGEAFTIDVSTLKPGLHTLYYQIEDKQGRRSGGHADIFYKLSVKDGKAKSAVYWFDWNDAAKQTVATAGENFEVDITALEPGLHALHYQTESEGGMLSPVVTDIFFVERTAAGASARFWIDDDEKDVRTLQMGKNEIVLDVSEMEVGDHTIFLNILDEKNLPLAIYTQPFQVYDLSRMGDVNADDEVDVADIVLTVSHIIGKNPTNFIRLRADINQDGNVTVEDIVGIIRIIGGLNENGEAGVKGFRVDADDVLTASMRDRLLSIGLKGEQRYTAFQLTLTLPEGTDVEEATIALNRRAGHRVAFGNAEDGRVTIVAYDLDGSTFLGESGSLLQVMTSALPDGDILVDNIIFVTPEGGTRRFAPFVIDSPTGIQQTTARQTADAPVYDLAGRRLGSRPQRAGVYIQNGKKMTVK